MRRRGRNKHHHVATLNILELVIRRTQRIKPADVDAHREIARANLAALAGEQAGPEERLMHLKSLADMLNLSETMAAMGLGRGGEAERILNTAKARLADLAASGAPAFWIATEEQADAVQWLTALHCDAQLAFCSYGEFERALKSTHERMRQALCGNAGPSTVVVTGELGSTRGAPV